MTVSRKGEHLDREIGLQIDPSARPSNAWPALDGSAVATSAIPITKKATGIPYPPDLIERLCDSLQYDRADRRFVHRVAKRHARGRATRPERMLLGVIAAALSPIPTVLTVGPNRFDIEFSPPDDGRDVSAGLKALPTAKPTAQE